jgi:RNA polymerase sigma-70 factor (ECF subfamily)
VTNFARRARGAVPALVNGAPGAAWAPGGQPRVVFRFTIQEDRIVGIELIADRDHLRELTVVIHGRH